MRHRSGRAALLLVIGLAVGSIGPAACSGDSGDRGSRKDAKVAFVIPNSQLNFANEMADGFRAGVQHVGGVEQVVEGPPIVDGPKQVQIFENLTKSSKDGISVFTLTPELFAAPLADAASKGIPLIAVDNQPPPASKVKLFVGNDNYQLGQLMADEAIAKLPAGATGRIVIGTSTPGVPVLDRRAKGMRDQINKKLPGVTVLGPFDTKQEVASNLAAWQTLVRANPTALAFLGTGDADGYNLAAIRRSTHGTWLAGAFDIDPKALQAVKDGDLFLMSPEHFVKGAVAGRLQAQHAKDGKPLPEGWYYTPGLLINKENVDTVIARQVSQQAKAAWFAAQIDTILKDPSYLRPLSQAG